MSDFSRLLWRGPRLGVALGVSFTAVLTLLILFQANARAAHSITVERLIVALLPKRLPYTQDRGTISGSPA